MRLQGDPNGWRLDAAAFTAREIEDGSGIARLLAFGDALQPGSRDAQPVREPAWRAPAGTQG